MWGEALSLQADNPRTAAGPDGLPRRLLLVLWEAGLESYDIPGGRCCCCTSHYPVPPGAYARLLFIDFSSAVNTILPHILMCKLWEEGVSLQGRSEPQTTDLLLNTPETKKILVDFRRKTSASWVFTSQRTCLCSVNTAEQTKKAQQRLYILRDLSIKI